VGFITVLVREGSVWIHTICVDREHQNSGIGTEVVKSFIAQAQEQRLPLCLSVLKVNPARQWYERLGFRVTDASKYHYHMKFEAD
jgi:ribosomal protein S18 acetylase RimI-like enzyme